MEKEAEKTEKYGRLRWELTRRYHGYRIVQPNVIMDVLGGWSQDLEAEMKKIFGLCSLDIFKRMLKAGLSGSLKGHSQLLHMRIRYHFVANLHVTLHLKKRV